MPVDYQRCQRGALVRPAYQCRAKGRVLVEMLRRPVLLCEDHLWETLADDRRLVRLKNTIRRPSTARWRFLLDQAHSQVQYTASCLVRTREDPGASDYGRGWAEYCYGGALNRWLGLLTAWDRWERLLAGERVGLLPSPAVSNDPIDHVQQNWRDHYGLPPAPPLPLASKAVVSSGA